LEVKDIENTWMSFERIVGSNYTAIRYSQGKNHYNIYSMNYNDLERQPKNILGNKGINIIVRYEGGRGSTNIGCEDVNFFLAEIAAKEENVKAKAK